MMGSPVRGMTKARSRSLGHQRIPVKYTSEEPDPTSRAWNLGLACAINSWARRMRPRNSSGVMGLTRSPSGLSEEKAGGSFPVEESAASATVGRSKTEELAAADEERNWRREKNR